MSHPPTAMPESAMDAAQIQRMKAAIAKVVQVGPGFLRGEVDVQRMTDTMIHAVRGYAEEEKAAGGDGQPRSPEAGQLGEVLRELYGCGAGFQADRCDAACVARTITRMVDEFTAAQG